MTTRYLAPVETHDLEQASPLVWTSHGENPGFVFDIREKRSGFVGFFLMTARGELAPKITFDQGAGFNELTAIVLKSFPFAFYHVSLDKMREVERLRFRPSRGGTVTFRFLPLRMNNAILVAILHFLFNLRYQKISVVSADEKGRTGTIAYVRSNVARIVKFFRDVSAGSGVKSQQGTKEVLPALKLFLSLEARAVEARMRDVLSTRVTPLISFVVPTYNTSTLYLGDLLQSFEAQNAGYAELVLSDDGSKAKTTLSNLEAAGTRSGVSLVLNQRNQGIAAATNAGIAAATGEWIAFIDHDDQFVPGAVAMIAQAIHDHPDADFFYTDEIIADVAMRPTGSFCKPAFDSVLLSGSNYINHFSVFRKARLKAIGCLRTDREGSQDYDLLLRYLDGARPGSVIHIPYLAYIWRREERTYSTVHIERSVANARLALEAHYGQAAQRIEPALDAHLHRVRFAARPSRVSVIIPNKNSLDLITRVIADLQTKTTYDALDIIIVDNGSTDPKVLAFYEAIKKSGVIVNIVVEPFNFAAMCNRGAGLARGDAFLFLNNDIEVRDADWLTEMMECLSFGSVGIVGAKLLYPNDLVQHNGVIVGLGGAAGHWYIGEEADEPGPMGRFNVRQTMTAVTGACMLVTRACFSEIGGFDADAFPISYNDIDLCLRARAAGYRTIWTPFASLIHHESISRGSDETGENNMRFKTEFLRLQERHGTADFLDDAYSPFFDRRYSKPHLIIPPALPPTRANLFD